METCRLIGIAGAGRGTGVTHLGIWTANYLTSFLQHKNAVIEWNRHGDFERLKRTFLPEKGKELPETKGAFQLLNVDYYGQGDSHVLAYCMERDYDEILLDFGEMREEIRTDWLRCETKILTVSLADWKLESFLEFLIRQEMPGKGWKIMTAFGSETTRKEIERQFRISIEKIPLSEDAFLVDRKAAEWFERKMRR